MDSLTAGREIPFSFAAYVLRTCKVWYRMPLYLNSTSISLDVLLTISPPHAIMVSQEKERKGNTMYVRMSWKEAKEKFNRHEDFVITCGNKSNPYGKYCYYARDYHIGEDNFLTAMEVLSVYNDGSVNCWKQVPDGVKEPQEGKLFCMKVFDRMERHYCTAYVRAGDVDLAKLEADYRCYTVVEIEEREM